MEFQQNPSRPVVLSRDVVITEGTSIPSKLVLGKLFSDAAPDSDRLRDKLIEIWAPSGVVNFWRVRDDAFLIQFHEAGDLTRVLDGAPWSSDGADLFLVQHVKPDMNMLDQVAGFTKAELWVQFRFHHGPDQGSYSNSVYALAERIGEPLPVNCEPSANSGRSLRARIRVDITRPLRVSIDVILENGKQALVSVDYKGIPSLCGSCRILGHPAGRCRRTNNPPAAAAAAAGSRREKPVGYVPSLLGSMSRASSSSSSLKDSPRQEEDDQPVSETAPAPPAPRSEQGRLSSVKGGWSNFIKFACLKRSTKQIGEKKPSSTEDNLEDQSQTNFIHNSVQESFIIEAQETALDTPLTSHFIVKPERSRSRKHTRTNVVLETQCPPQLIMGAMQWQLSEKSEGLLSAEYDGNRGVLRIHGLQIDQNTDSVDDLQVTHRHPKNSPIIGLVENGKKPDSPARFAATMEGLIDVNCRKDSQKERTVTFNGISKNGV